MKFLNNHISYLVLLTPIIALAPFFLTSQFILLDDHEVFRLHFSDLNFFTAIYQDWRDLNRFRPFYWLIRQSQSFLFSLSPAGWYSSSLLFLTATLIFCFSFFKQLHLKNLTSIILSWTGLLGLHSLNSWMALGPQEGIALCFFCGSLYYATKKNIWISLLFAFLSVLTKETFVFSFFTPVLFYAQDNYVGIKKWLVLFTSIPIILSPIYIIKTLQLLKEKHQLGINNFWAIPQPTSLQSYIDHLSTAYGVIVSLLLLVGSITYLTYKFIVKREKNRLAELLSIASMSTTFIFQFILYSFTDYTAPHYVQPLSLLIIATLALAIKQNKTFEYPTIYILILTIPFTFFQTISTANNHNFYSRRLQEAFITIESNNINQIIFAGHKSYDHEAIYSFATRVQYFYPKTHLSFVHYPSTYHQLEGISDLSDLYGKPKNDISPKLLLNFSDKSFNSQNESQLKLTTEPLLPIYPTSSTFYTVLPNFSEIEL